MTLQELLKLGEMGFTKDEIMALSKAEEPKPEEPKPEDNGYNALKSELDELKKLMQKQAIENSVQPERKTVDDMLTDLLKGL